MPRSAPSSSRQLIGRKGLERRGGSNGGRIGWPASATRRKSLFLPRLGSSRATVPRIPAIRGSVPPPARTVRHLGYREQASLCSRERREKVTPLTGYPAIRPARARRGDEGAGWKTELGPRCPAAVNCEEKQSQVRVLPGKSLLQSPAGSAEGLSLFPILRDGIRLRFYEKRAENLSTGTRGALPPAGRRRGITGFPGPRGSDIPRSGSKLPPSGQLPFNDACIAGNRFPGPAAAAFLGSPFRFLLW